MDKTGQSLLRLLFNEGESVSVSNNEFAFHSIPLESTLDGEITLQSPNPLVFTSYCHSSDLTLVSINPCNGFRRDENVTAYRSFLVELDTGSIPDQLGTIKHLKMPFSAQVFSGSKSVHTAIILDEDLKDEKQYRYIAEWILAIVPLVDKKCKNPSRMIRIPGAYRGPGKKQRLIKLGKRVTQKELMDWLNQYENLRPKVREKKEIVAGEGDYEKLSPWAQGMLKNGLVFKNGRNQTWFGLAVDFAKAGYTEDVAIEKLGALFEEEYDFKEKEWLITISSAFKYVGEGKS